MPFRVLVALWGWLIVGQWACALIGHRNKQRKALRTWVLNQVPKQQHRDLFYSPLAIRAISMRRCPVCPLRGKKKSAMEADSIFRSRNIGLVFERPMTSGTGENQKTEVASTTVTIDLACCEPCSKVSDSKFPITGVKAVYLPPPPTGLGRGRVTMEFILHLQDGWKGTAPPVSDDVQRRVAGYLLKFPSTREVTEALTAILPKGSISDRRQTDKPRQP